MIIMDVYRKTRKSESWLLGIGGKIDLFQIGGKIGVMVTGIGGSRYCRSFPDCPFFSKISTFDL